MSRSEPDTLRVLSGFESPPHSRNPCRVALRPRAVAHSFFFYALRSPCRAAFIGAAAPRKVRPRAVAPVFLH
eukprot:7541344-Pyramimonas_sp.AAC.1